LEILANLKIQWEKKLDEAEFQKEKLEMEIQENLINFDRNLGPRSLKFRTAVEAIGATKRAFFQAYTAQHIQRICQRMDRLLALLPAEISTNQASKNCATGLKLLNRVHGIIKILYYFYQFEFRILCPKIPFG
jgi:hypothetical protein